VFKSRCAGRGVVKFLVSILGWMDRSLVSDISTGSCRV
jgi:hypothetical protein